MHSINFQSAAILVKGAKWKRHAQINPEVVIVDTVGVGFCNIHQSEAITNVGIQPNLVFNAIIQTDSCRKSYVEGVVILVGTLPVNIVAVAIFGIEQEVYVRSKE